MAVRSRTRAGFTLLELMMSVAVIGVLSVIAIPQFLQFQARSRQAEAYTNLSSMARAYQGFYADSGRYPDMMTETGEPTLPKPAPILGAEKLEWDAQTQAFFDIVGWGAEGDVVYTYDIHSYEAGDCGCTANCFTATAHGDTDGDGNWSALMFAVPQTDADGNVVGECSSRVGALFAPGYSEVRWNAGLDRY